MLPSLKNLPLTSPSATAGFYVPSSAEVPTLNDDPITLAPPLQDVPATFRISLAARGPNGEPRYKYFDPLALWTWVKDNNSLPTRESPIWYEDWWALCNMYNPTHANVPSWAYSLKTEAAYRDEEAARIAQAQAEAARIAMAEAEAAARAAAETRIRARELDREAREAEERAAAMRRRVNDMTTDPGSGDGSRPSPADVGPSNSHGAAFAVYRQSLEDEEGPYYRHPPAFDDATVDEEPRFRDLGAREDEPPRFRDLSAREDEPPRFLGLSAPDEPAPPLQALSAPDEPAPSFMDLSAERAEQLFAEQQAAVYRGLEYQTRIRDGD